MLFEIQKYTHLKKNNTGSLKINELSRIHQKNKKKNKVGVEIFGLDKAESKRILFKGTVGNILHRIYKNV